MTSPLLGEFMGTLVLILLGNGCVANVLLKHSKAHGSGWMVITSGWAFAVMSAVFVAIACGSRDAHINPAVTLGLAVASGSYSKVVSYSLAQMAGAFWGQCWSGPTSDRTGRRRKIRNSSACAFAARPRSATFMPTCLAKSSALLFLFLLREPFSRER